METAVLTCYCIVYLYIEKANQRRDKASVITGLIQNTIICVNLAGSGGVIRWWPYCEPNVDILLKKFILQKRETQEQENGKILFHIFHFCKFVT